MMNSAEYSLITGVKLYPKPYKPWFDH